MAKVLIVLLVGLVLEAVGVVFLSKGLKEIGELPAVNLTEIARVLRLGIMNPSLLAGVAFEAAFFGALLYLLSQRDVSLIWPLTSLGFVITALAAKFMLHEQVAPLRWAGIALIVVGAGLVTWSEKLKQPPPSAGVEASAGQTPQ
jgi:drug/metabolite transporter (DMT)-like permease